MSLDEGRKVRVRKIRSFGKIVVLPTFILALILPTTAAPAEEAGPVPTAEPAVVDGDAAIPVGDEGNDPAADSAVSRQDRIAAETVHAFGSRKSNDLMGYEPSLYQGKWHMPKREKLRRCISKAESRHNYRAGRGGFYRGAYQFSPALSRGVTWMMQPEVRKEMGKDGLRLIQKLRDKPMNKWNRYWQDRAFWTIWAKGTGKKHWPTRRMC
jgi:hypothetical protein